MYTTVLPALHKIDPALLYPHVYYASNDELVLIMENLKLAGFSLGDMVAGLDKERAEKALEWMARMHAASYHYLRTYEGGLAKFGAEFSSVIHDDWVSQRDKMMKMFLEAFLGSADTAFKAIIAEHLKEKRPDLVQRVMQFRERHGERLASLHNAMGSFSCLIHNDAWTNNFLFK